MIVNWLIQIPLGAISYPEPSNFLQRMLDENEGLKDRFLGDLDWSSEM